MVKASRKNPPTHTEPTKNKEYLKELGERLQRRNLEIVKRQNRNYLKKQRGKRRRSSGEDESESEQIVKKCYDEWLKEGATSGSGTPMDKNDDKDEVAEECYKAWRRDEYDSYNCINRKVLLSKIEMFEGMIKSPKKFECGQMSETIDVENKIMWTSPTYVARYIRKCILRHKWAELAHLLLLLTKHSHLYESYTREMTFLTTFMNIDKCERNLLADLELCFITEKMQKRKEFDVWYVEKSPQNTDNR